MFDDSGWKYNFIILMTIIFIGCGIYTLIKIYLQKKKSNKEKEKEIEDKDRLDLD